MSLENCKIIYISPSEAPKYLPDGRPLNHAQTVFDPLTGEPTILIDSGLSTAIQEVYLVHERVQLNIIQEWDEQKRPRAQILHKAHEIGLREGLKHATELGVLEEYQKLRNSFIKARN